MISNGYRPKVAAVAMAALLVLATAACGGGSSDSSAPSIVSSESSTTTAGSSSGTSSSSSSGGSSGSSDVSDALGALGGQAGACIEIGLAYASISLAMLGGLGAALGADQSQMDDAATQLEDVQADVPDELKDDFATLQKGFESFNSAVTGGSGNILDPSYQQQVEEAGKALETPEFLAAQKTVEDYLDANCPQ